MRLQDARENDDTLIIARTDAISVAGLDEALRRGSAYAEAGADVLFVESPRDREELARIGAELGARIPLLANMVEGGKTPILPAPELRELGFKLVIFPRCDGPRAQPRGTGLPQPCSAAMVRR